MRYLLVIGLLVIGFGSSAQMVDIYIDTLEKQVYHDVINSHDEVSMYGEQYNYKYEIVEKVIFYSKPENSLSQKLKDSGIKVLYDYDNPSVVTQWENVEKQPGTPVSMATKAYSTQSTGVMFQIIGIGAMAAATAISFADYPDNPTQEDYDRRKNTVQALAIGGGLSFTVGITIKLNGDRQLFEAVHP